jgi:nucleotide-binding universal stress UspA family protein
MGTPRRIVAAIDLSPISRAVVALAERLAAKGGFGVTAVFVIEPIAEIEDRSILLPMLRRMVDDTEKEMETAYRSFVDALPPALPFVERICHLGRGKVHSEIIRAARVGDAPLILLGAPRSSALSATTFGRILRRVPAPALVVRKPPAGGYRKVVVGVDFSPLSEGALVTVGQVAESDAEIILLNVLPRLSGENIFAGHEEALEKRRVQLLELAARVLPGRTVGVEVITGSARSDIAEKAKELEADLVAVGVGADTTLSEVFLGSVAEAVARNAHCDVLVHSVGRGG